MNWRIKATTQKFIAMLPDKLSYKVYRTVQRHLGRLVRVKESYYSPIKNFNSCLRFIQGMAENGKVPEGKTFLEIGTGWNVNIPMGLWLCGAKKIITIDVNPFLTEELVLGSLDYIKKNNAGIKSMFEPYSKSPLFKKKFDFLLQFNGGMKELLESLGIVYFCPGDASSISIENQSVDCHYSESVLEYIQWEDLCRIFREAKRVLKSDGLLLHNILLQDQFCGFDPNITSVNFLKFSDEKWEKIAGNKYAFTPRLRTYDFDRLFQEIGVTILKKKEVVNQKALTVLNQGFPLAEKFMGNPNRDLAVSHLYIIGSFKKN